MAVGSIIRGLLETGGQKEFKPSDGEAPPVPGSEVVVPQVGRVEVHFGVDLGLIGGQPLHLEA